MYLRRIDEIMYLNQNKLFFHSVMCDLCGSECSNKRYIHTKFRNQNHYHYYCRICSALYKRVYNFDNSYNVTSVVLFQLCFDNDNPELDIIKRYLDMGDNSEIFAVDHDTRSSYESGKLSYKSGSLRIITTNEKDIFAYGKNRALITQEEVIFGKE